MHVINHGTMSMKQSYPLPIFAQETRLYMVQKAAVDLFLVTRSKYVRNIDLTLFLSAGLWTKPKP